MIRLQHDDTTTHSTTTKVIEITICVLLDCDMTMTKNWRSFFARVEWKQARAIRRSWIVVVLQSNCNCNHSIRYSVKTTLHTDSSLFAAKLQAFRLTPNYTAWWLETFEYTQLSQSCQCDSTMTRWPQVEPAISWPWVQRHKHYNTMQHTLCTWQIIRLFS